MKILLLNGPNLNLLGEREPEIYGATTLADIEAALARRAEAGGASLETFQTNHEGEAIERIHAARRAADAIIINPAAWTHTSVALLDALNAFDGPVVEVHLSNVHKRESFRHHSYVSMRADGVIAGLGAFGYAAALDFVLRQREGAAFP
ncbi:type II 3-dehydroquinate dehydratase [Salinisphaera sp. LB1]|uniref:type II 3-dehydroquinate dehydratase n=1 Tax=Salinisphaera sp. LB1 TaxID=2183911 RepID=UPI000D706D23|nr:type II 3-dehydroquinate dehydratase [Salinisphaera sp. LB1]AWN15280.1 3-dehydroquinate dehydratase II [Salinisphaera sp. LB1]